MSIISITFTADKIYTLMIKSLHSFEKRKKEIARKKKRADKIKRKTEKKENKNQEGQPSENPENNQ